jgi:hypothetical protein
VATVVFPQPPFVFITTILNTAIHRKSPLKQDQRLAVNAIGLSGEYLKQRHGYRRGGILRFNQGEQQHCQDGDYSNI